VIGLLAVASLLLVLATLSSSRHVRTGHGWSSPAT